MIPLPVCACRGSEVTPGRWACRNTTLIVSRHGVDAKTCAECNGDGCSASPAHRPKRARDPNKPRMSIDEQARKRRA